MTRLLSLSFVLRIFPLPWYNINQLIYVKKVTSLSLCHVNYNQCNFQQTRLSIYMTPLLTFNTCLVMLCLLVHFLDHFWMTSILFDVNMYRRFFSISKLVNWVISDPPVQKSLKNQKFSHVVHFLVSLIMCLALLKNRTHDFSMFTLPKHLYLHKCWM